MKCVSRHSSMYILYHLEQLWLHLHDISKYAFAKGCRLLGITAALTGRYPCSKPRLFFFLRWSGTQLTITEANTGLLHQPRMIDDDECRAIGGMLGRGNQSTRRKPAPVPLCLPQIPHDLTRARTRAAAMGTRRLTAWATGRPTYFESVITWNRILEKITFAQHV
jgi:hypothetical protein